MHAVVGSRQVKLVLLARFSPKSAAEAVTGRWLALLWASRAQVALHCSDGAPCSRRYSLMTLSTAASSSLFTVWHRLVGLRDRLVGLLLPSEGVCEETKERALSCQPPARVTECPSLSFPLHRAHTYRGKRETTSDQSVIRPSHRLTSYEAMEETTETWSPSSIMSLVSSGSMSGVLVQACLAT